MELALSLETGFNTTMKEGGGGSVKPLWTPANLSSPPHISIDADNLALLTKDGSNNLLTVTTEFTALAAGTITAVTHVSDSVLNNKNAFSVNATNASQVINFASTAGNLLASKPGCTMVFLGRFNDAAASAVNRAIVNATTTSNNSTRCSLATSSTTANRLRYTVRRLDTDTANGDDDTFGQRVTTSPFIAVIRQDNLGAVVGGGTPTKEMIIVQAGVRTTMSEATGLGSGNYDVTNSALIGFFNSGSVAPCKNNMNWGAIDDVVWTNDEVERTMGWAAWKLGMASSILEVGNPYRNAPPRQL